MGRVLQARIAIIGAGVIGCALARELSSDSHEINVFERHEKIAQETSSRNSGVIHAGFYYPPESLKAKLCIQGRKLLYEWSAVQDVPFKKVGKLVVAQKGEENDLNKLYDNALQSGVS